MVIYSLFYSKYGVLLRNMEFSKFFLSKLIFFSLILLLYPYFAFSSEFNDIKIPKDETLPIKVGFYIDEKGSKSCETIHDTYFIETQPRFNPALYNEVIWLDIKFPNSRAKNGKNLVLGFGAEYLDFAEMYIPTKDGWTFYGRTGHNILREDKTNPSWRLNIPFNLDELNESQGFVPKSEDFYHIRVKMKSSLGSPINIIVATERNFNKDTITLTIFHFLLIGIFLFVSGFMCFYGFTFRDDIYKNLGFATICFLLMQLQVTGIGQSVFWNDLCRVSYAPRFFYIIELFLVYFMTTSFRAIIKEEHGPENLNNILPYILVLLTINIIIILLVPSNIIVSICSSILYIFCSILFITIIGMITFGNKALHIQMFFQIPAFLLIAGRQLFYLARTSPDNPFYTIYTDDYFFINYLIFTFIEIPPIYLTGKRIILRVQAITQVAVKNKKENQKLINQFAFYNAIAHELLDLSNIIRTSIRLPYKPDTKEGKENASLIERSAVQTVDMLNTVCVTSGTEDAKELPIVFNDFFDSCLSLILPLARLRGNIVEIHKNIEKKLIVYGDPNLLEYIVSDFLSMMIEYSPKDTGIIIDLSSSKNTIHCSITSQINSSGHKSIKQIFEDNDSDFTKKKVNQYFLVGFNLIKKGLQHYNGNFDITPTASGYRFSINLTFKRIAFEYSDSLPLITELLVSQEVKDYSIISTEQLLEQSLKAAEFSQNILVIEEVAQNRDILFSMLKNLYTVTTINTGVEAWDYLHSSAPLPDYILAEFELPIMSGLELFRQCSQDERLKNIPFIFILPVSMYSKKSELLSKGASGCITKPFTQQEIIDTLISIRNVALCSHSTFMSQITTVINTPHSPTPLPEPVHIEQASKKTTPMFANFNLSNREQQIALLILEGKSDKEIAAALDISPGTVASHNKNLFKKLDVHSRVELMNKLR